MSLLTKLFARVSTPDGPHMILDSVRRLCQFPDCIEDTTQALLDILKQQAESDENSIELLRE